MLLMSCGGPKLSLDDAVQSVKTQIIQDELIDRYIKRERRNLDDAVNDFFRRYAHNGVTTQLLPTILLNLIVCL